MVRESSRDLVGLRIFVIYVSDTWLMNRDRHSLEVCLQGQGLSNINNNIVCSFVTMSMKASSTLCKVIFNSSPRLLTCRSQGTVARILYCTKMYLQNRSIHMVLHQCEYVFEKRVHVRQVNIAGIYHSPFLGSDIVSKYMYMYELRCFISI